MTCFITLASSSAFTTSLSKNWLFFRFKLCNCDVVHANIYTHLKYHLWPSTSVNSIKCINIRISIKILSCVRNDDPLQPTVSSSWDYTTFIVTVMESFERLKECYYLDFILIDTKNLSKVPTIRRHRRPDQYADFTSYWQLWFMQNVCFILMQL